MSGRYLQLTRWEFTEAYAHIVNAIAWGNVVVHLHEALGTFAFLGGALHGGLVL